MNHMLCPKKKWSEPIKSKSMVPECPEDKLQMFADSFLKLKKLRYIRIPDSFFKWIVGGHIRNRVYIPNVPQKIKVWFLGMFGGYPDNTVIEPIGNGIALALLMELKTQDKKGRKVGSLHGKQKHHKDEWVICRSPEQIQEAVKQFEKTVDKIKKIVND